MLTRFGGWDKGRVQGGRLEGEDLSGLVKRDREGYSRCFFAELGLRLGIGSGGT